MKTKMKRREFIKITGASTGGLLVGSKLYADFSRDDKSGKNRTQIERTPTYCEMCFWKCAGWV